MDDLIDGAKFFGCVLIALALLFAGLIGGLAGMEAYQCNVYQGVTGKPTKYEGLSCFVQDGGNWYAWTEYKYRLVTKGEFTKR